MEWYFLSIGLWAKVDSDFFFCFYFGNSLPQFVTTCDAFGLYSFCRKYKLKFQNLFGKTELSGGIGKNTHTIHSKENRIFHRRIFKTIYMLKEFCYKKAK